MTFVEYYNHVTGRDPFPWQSVLADHVVAHGWPKSVDVPTAGGKTGITIIAQWLHDTDSTHPRRVWWCIDRRIVVDQVARQNRDEKWKGVVLRGGAVDDWSPRADEKTLIATTVDQLGSRLLFRGYGQSWKHHGVWAGVARHDSIVFVDEAHLSTAFTAALEATGVPFVELTATPRKSEGAWHLDRDNLGRVLSARWSKPRHIKLSPGKVIDEAREVFQARSPQRLLVTCNTAVRAREAHTALSSLDADVILITGRQRAYDRQKILDQWIPVIGASPDRKDPRRPVIVVATQCVEVGADIDLDALVTECASLDALYQRFGRVNRLGLLESVPVTVCRLPDDQFGIYGDACRHTWKYLMDQSNLTWTTLDQPPIPGECRAAQVDFPMLNDSVLRDLSATSKPQHPIDVAPYLHGVQEAYSVTLVWRDKCVESALQVMPPAGGEGIQVPFNKETQDWIKDRHHIIYGDGKRPIQVGDTIIVSTSEGGVDQWGWNPGSTCSVQDVAELVDRSLHRSWDRDDLTGRRVSSEDGLFTVVFRTLRNVSRVLLTDHVDQVVEAARRYARVLGLNEEDSRDLIDAAKWHDVGKAHPRWQLAAYNGDALAAAVGPVLGKTDRFDPSALNEFRHEEESARQAIDEGLTDRAVRLIRRHHGFNRGGDEQPYQCNLEHLLMLADWEGS